MPETRSKSRRSRIALWLGISFALFVACIVWLIARPRAAEPVYNGKPLSQWLASLEQNGGLNFPRESLGTNAVAVLLAGVEMPSNPFKSVYRKLWPALPAWVEKKWPRPVDAGLVRKNAAYFLCTCMADNPLRIKLLRTHPRSEVRAAAAGALGHGMYDTEATAALVEALNDNDARVRRAASAAFSETAWNRQWLAVVPTMLEKLGDSDAQVRTNATEIMNGVFTYRAGEIAAAYNASPKEKDALVRKLVKIVKANRLPEREAAVHWLRIIDQRAARDAGVK